VVDARTPQIKHLSVRCKYEVALPTAVNDSGVQPQLLVAVRNVRASRQWWTTGLLNVDTRPRTSSLRSRGCREIHAHSPRDDPALVYEYTRRSVLRNRSRSTSASVVVPRREASDHVLTDGLARSARGCRAPRSGASGDDAPVPGQHHCRLDKEAPKTLAWEQSNSPSWATGSEV
jgi:hypothetical protein